MPYSEAAHSRTVAGALACMSMISMESTIPLGLLYPVMHLPWADLQGKTTIVTGANSGIGYECARTFASMGARVVLACRNECRGEDAKQKIIQETGNDKVEMEVLDFTSLGSVREFVNRWEKRESKQVDVLLNNAGVMMAFLKLTVDGFEQTYQTNHLSHVLLTVLLLNRGYMSPTGRIISVSSVLAYHSDLLDNSNADNGDLITKYNAEFGTKLTSEEMLNIYSRSKASQAVWTIALQRYLAKSDRWKGVTVQACHPGYVTSPMWMQPEGCALIDSMKIKALFAIAKVTRLTTEQGAVVPIWLATAKEPTMPELQGMFWNRMRWTWVWPWMLEPERQNMLWDKWCKDARISLLV
ncbi:short chain dehydrogenase [Ceratobasidium sp. AG-Ba]|nr:short chain dehydrogenase [Ceratobasidium sp. AG-Ba]